MVKVEVYSATYGDFDRPQMQPVPMRLFTDRGYTAATYLQLAQNFPKYEPDQFARVAAKWWKLHPEAACPDADVTVWIDGNMTVLVPDFRERCLAALADADAIFVRHPERDDIYEEAVLSEHLAKYDGQPLCEQVDAYRLAGHPEHWGLMHAGLLVRRNTKASRALNAAWWSEIMAWSLQDQLSLPPLLRTMAVDFRWFDVSPFDAGWLRWGEHGHGQHSEPDVWRPNPLTSERSREYRG